MAGMVNPEDAGTGAMIGGVLPIGVKAAGIAGQGVSRLIRLISGKPVSDDARQAIEAARAAGYVIPPSQAKPTLVNRALEGFAGKLTTAQNASAKNQEITNKFAAKALGLSDDVKITPDVLKNIRSTAGQAYEDVKGTGTIIAGQAYDDALNKIAAPYLQAAKGFPGATPSPVIDLVESLRTRSFDAGSAVEKLKELRSAADDAFRTGNTDIARANKAAAKVLEDTIEQHLQSTGKTGMLQGVKDARQLIAKSYTVEKALNQATGTVDATKLAAQLSKGKPLTGDLKQVAQFAQRFPKASQTVEKMGSLPGTSPLDWAGFGTLSALTANPYLLAGVAARPAARSLTLSNLVQNRLATGSGQNSLTKLLQNPELQQLMYRGAPVMGAQ
jgi:hypothetical protein